MMVYVRLCATGRTEQDVMGGGTHGRVFTQNLRLETRQLDVQSMLRREVHRASATLAAKRQLPIAQSTRSYNEAFSEEPFTSSGSVYGRARATVCADERSKSLCSCAAREERPCIVHFQPVADIPMMQWSL
jgi:hypothetical protein